MKQWQCVNCGHIMESEERPIKHWDDGHYCAFIEIADMPTAFNVLNNALVHAGYVTEHPTNQEHENILVTEKGTGQIVAAISAMPRSNMVKVLRYSGEVEIFAPTDTAGMLRCLR